jgi:SpoVK/Ycf46/Vps4 family AAA+-type ATPase
MQNRPQAVIDWVLLAEITEYYTPAELEYIVNEAARLALEDRRVITE